MPPLRSDCARCRALCCIAYPAEETPGFAATKAAGEPCPNLGPKGDCTIYADRAQVGFAGCVGYECFGAGQYVVQHLHDGGPVTPEMLEDFLLMRPISDGLFAIAHARTNGFGGGLEDIEETLVAASATRAALRDERKVATTLQRLRKLLRERRK